MRRISLVVLVSAAAVVFPTNAVASKHHGKHGKHHAKQPAKPGAIKTGTYKATALATGLVAANGTAVEQFNITLESGNVAVPNAPYIVLATPARFELPLSSFATPAALPSSGTLTEHAPTTADTVPGAPPATGQNTFSVTFSKDGTASGYFEATMTFVVGTETVTETPVKVPFTAKLG